MSEQVLVNTHGAAGSSRAGSSSYLNVKFNSGSAVLTGGSSSEISRVAASLDCASGSTAKIVGHTDSQGGADANMSLSRNRAKAVYDALVAAGVSSSCISYEGMGENSPIADNSTADGRRQNRRVELISYGGGSSSTTTANT